jgi:hypothetical protein
MGIARTETHPSANLDDRSSANILGVDRVRQTFLKKGWVGWKVLAKARPLRIEYSRFLDL